MSKPSRRPTREARKIGLKEKKKASRRALKEQKNQKPPNPTLPNRKSGLKTVEEEKDAIQLLTEEQLKVYGQLLPGLLKKLSKILSYKPSFSRVSL